MPKWISVFLIIAIAHMQFAVCGSSGCACSSKSASDACCSDSTERDHSEHDEDSCHHHCHVQTHRENEHVSHSFNSADQLTCVVEVPRLVALVSESIECHCTCPICIAHRGAHIAANHLITQPRQGHSKLSLAIPAVYIASSSLGFDSVGTVAYVTRQPSSSLSIFDSLCRLRI